MHKLEYYISISNYSYSTLTGIMCREVDKGLYFLKSVYPEECSTPRRTLSQNVAKRPSYYCTRSPTSEETSLRIHHCEILRPST
jgi:hypothetical protein